MRKELSSKIIYNDFISKTFLNELEQEILIKYIKNKSIIQISDETLQSTATVSRTISQLKIKYNNYKKLEMSKLLLFERNNKKWQELDNFSSFFCAIIKLERRYKLSKVV